MCDVLRKISDDVTLYSDLIAHGLALMLLYTTATLWKNLIVSEYPIHSRTSQVNQECWQLAIDFAILFILMDIRSSNVGSSFVIGHFPSGADPHSWQSGC